MRIKQLILGFIGILIIVGMSVIMVRAGQTPKTGPIYSTPLATYSHLQPSGAAAVPESETCGPWSSTDNGSVGMALNQKYGELRNCMFFDNSWIITTLGLQGQSGIVAVYRCASTDSACLDGRTDHPLAGWTVYVPPCKGGETAVSSDPSTGKILILGGCEQWFDVSSGNFSARYYSTP